MTSFPTQMSLGAAAVSAFALGLAVTPSSHAQTTPSRQVMACFYECKPAPSSPTVPATSWIETTTLMVANEMPPFGPVGAHVPTHRAHLLYVDGNERALLRTQTLLSGWDLDEVHVCRTLRANGAPVPPAGLVQIAIEPLPNTPTFSPGHVDVWIKNLLGKFSFGKLGSEDLAADDPFVTGRVSSLGKTECRDVPKELSDKAFDAIVSYPVLNGRTVLIERTEDLGATVPPDGAVQ